MHTLGEVGVCAPAVPEIIVLPRLARSCGAGCDRVLVNEYLDGSEIPVKVAGLSIASGQLSRSNANVMLGGVRVLVAKELLQFEE